MDNLPDRFWTKVEERPGPLDTPCWHWTAAQHAHGYGAFKMGGKCRRAHSLTWDLFIGVALGRLVLDHLCRNRRCCNPWHLEPVTHRQNIMRGEGYCAQQARKTDCVNGHAFTPENTRIRSDNGGRRCKQCEADTQRRYHRRKREAVAA